MTIVIDDKNSFEDDGKCAMAIRLYASDIEYLDCNVPRSELILWDGWKNRALPDASAIKNSCRVVSSLKGVSIESAG